MEVELSLNKLKVNENLKDEGIKKKLKIGNKVEGKEKANHDKHRN
jgi:hypothetical protein